MGKNYFVYILLTENNTLYCGYTDNIEKRFQQHIEGNGAKYTKAYRLKNKYIIHTVGPIYDIDPNPAKTLASCYQNCVKIADDLGLETIAFSSISTGVYGYPVIEAAAVVAKVVCEYQPIHLKQAYMCIWPEKQDHLNAYNREFDKYKQ